MIEGGHAIPNVEVGILVDGEPASRKIRELVADARSLIIGVPGAFTPTCTHHHLPNVANRLGKLREAGISRFFIVCPDNPWAVQTWSQAFPFRDEFTWLSDGNHDFARRCGLIENGTHLFLGETSKRFAMQTNDVVVERLSVEDNALKVTCTSGDAQVQLARK